MNNIFFNFAISMALILFVLMAFSFGIGHAESPPLEATQSPTKKCPEKWTVVCNKERTHCYDEKIQPDKKATSKPTKRFWTKPGKKQCLLTTKADNLGDGPFLEDFKNWLSDPKEDCKSDPSVSDATMPSDLSTTTTTLSTPSTTTEKVIKKELNLTGNNVLYFSGSSKINSQFKITFLQLNGDEQNNIEVNVTEKGSILAKWMDETNLLTVEPDQNQGKNDKLVFVLLSQNDVNKFLLTINGKQLISEKNADNFNYIQVSGDIQIQPTGSPAVLPNLAEDYKEAKKFDTMVRPDILKVPANSYINLYLIAYESTAGQSQITIYLGCLFSCLKEDPKKPLSLNIDLKKKRISAKTYDNIRDEDDLEKWSPLDDQTNLPLSTNFIFGQPIWLMIKQNQLEDGGKYNVSINDQNVLTIKSNKKGKDRRYTHFDTISMEGDVFLFNKPIPFPLRYTMKSEKSGKLPENLQISVKGVVMPNADKLEFILVTPKSNKNAQKYNNIERLGNENFDEF